MYRGRLDAEAHVNQDVGVYKNEFSDGKTIPARAAP